MQGSQQTTQTHTGDALGFVEWRTHRRHAQEQMTRVRKLLTRRNKFIVA